MFPSKESLLLHAVIENVVDEMAALLKATAELEARDRVGGAWEQLELLTATDAPSATEDADAVARRFLRVLVPALFSAEYQPGEPRRHHRGARKPWWSEAPTRSLPSSVMPSDSGPSSAPSARTTPASRPLLRISPPLRDGLLQQMPTSSVIKCQVGYDTRSGAGTGSADSC